MGLKAVVDNVICSICGKKYSLLEAGWEIYRELHIKKCDECGVIIYANKLYNVNPECDICLDEGLIIKSISQLGNLYHNAFACIFQKGIELEGVQRIDEKAIQQIKDNSRENEIRGVDVWRESLINYQMRRELQVRTENEKREN